MNKMSETYEQEDNIQVKVRSFHLHFSVKFNDNTPAYYINVFTFSFLYIN